MAYLQQSHAVTFDGAVSHEWDGKYSKRKKKTKRGRRKCCINQLGSSESSSLASHPGMDLPSHFIAIAGLILGLMIWYHHRRGKSKGVSPPEAPGAWPIIGHLHLLRGDVPVFRTLAAMADKLGPVFMIRLGTRRAFVVSDDKVAKECFTTNDKVFASRPASAAAKLMGYNSAAFFLAPYGPLWRDMRKLSIMELLSPRRLDGLMDVQVSELKAGIKDLYMVGKDNEWANPKKVVMNEWLENLGFNVILMMVAGKRCFSNLVDGSREARSATEAMKKFMTQVGAFVPSDVLPFLECFDIQGHLSAMKLVAKELDSYIESLVEEHRGRQNSEASGRQDFIDALLNNIKDASLYGYSRDTIIKSTLLGMILGGADTISVASTWILSLLLNNKHVMKQAQEELDLKVGRDRWVEQSDMENLVYIKAIVKETLRLYPTVPLLVPHEAMEDCEVGGYHIPKGTRLIVNAWKLQRDAAVWPNPEEFQPERFLTTHANVDVFGQNFELIPFGSGRRSCPGVSMAIRLLYLTMARLLQGFDMATPSNSPVDMKEGVGITILKVTPLEIMLSPRLPVELY